MKTKSLVVVLAVFAIATVVYLTSSKKEIWEVNADLLKEEVLSIEESVQTVNLLDLTPFAWEYVYSFAPYTSKDTIYETVGYEWDRITETVNEGMNQIVFLKDGKVVCYLYGYPENNGYGIFFTYEDKKQGSSPSVLTTETDLTFSVIRGNGIILLTM